jgi:hypothetical protein
MWRPTRNVDELSRQTTRRTAVQLLAGGIGATVVGAGVTTATDTADTVVSLTNVGAQAWEVTGIDGTGITADDGNNPTLTFTETSKRYRIENGGYSAHPLEFRADDGTALLSQSRTGSFESDAAVNWTDSGDAVEFTLTSELNNLITEYACTIHGAMVGTVASDVPTVDYTPETGSVSFTAPDDGVTVEPPVTFEMTATDFVIEAASNGVTDGHGHFHILVDKSAVAPGETIPFEEGYNHYGDGSTSAELRLSQGTHTIRLQAGDANHRAYDLTDTIELTVEAPPDTVDRFDDDGDGEIDLSEVQDAIRAFSNGEVDLQGVQQVIAAFSR